LLHKFAADIPKMFSRGMDQQIIVKVDYNGDVRRFKVDPKTTSFESFRQLLEKLFGVALELSIVLFTWKDDENDYITLSSDIDWQEAVRTTLNSQTRLLKLRITNKKFLSRLTQPPKCLAIFSNRVSPLPFIGPFKVKFRRPVFDKCRSLGVTIPKYARLSNPIAQLSKHYQVVVVGSGYGGSILSSRLSRAGLQVCLLERGKELQPGQYPNTLQEIVAEMRLTLPDGSVYGPENGFMDWTISNNVVIWKGCGLGGGSLVNSNVSIKPDPRVYDMWPVEFKQNPQLLEDAFNRAFEVLCPNPYPFSSTQPLGKMMSLQKAMQGLGGKWYPADVNVTFKDRTNVQGIFQPACKLCGDCNTGCNFGSKNTLIMNYIPDAKQHGAEIYTGIEVLFIEPLNGGQQWALHCRLIGDDEGNVLEDNIQFQITANIVVLAAGSLGSTEILLRSRQMGGLKTSNQLGLNFGADGDFFGLGYNTPYPVNDVGYGNNPPDVMKEKEGPVGPCICSVWDLRDPNKPVTSGFIVEDMAIPGAFAELLSGALAFAALWFGDNTDPKDKEAEALRIIQSLIEGPYYGATRNTLLFGGMSFDNQSGVMTLQDNRLVLNWKDPIDKNQNAVFQQTLKAATANLQGDYIDDPFANPPFPKILRPFFNKRRGSVHPLGGCCMADSAEKGVVNHKGQVYADTTGTAVYQNLYVADGAIVPTSIGVNPLFTISALAERIAFLMAQDHGLKIDYSSNSVTLMRHSLSLKW
jgi:cholesterol oxidase